MTNTQSISLMASALGGLSEDAIGARWARDTNSDTYTVEACGETIVQIRRAGFRRYESTNGARATSLDDAIDRAFDRWKTELGEAMEDGDRGVETILASKAMTRAAQACAGAVIAAMIEHSDSSATSCMALASGRVDVRGVRFRSVISIGESGRLEAALTSTHEQTGGQALDFRVPVRNLSHATLHAASRNLAAMVRTGHARALEAVRKAG